jgi:hypothetical protein
MKPLIILKRLLVCSALASLPLVGLAADALHHQTQTPGWLGVYLSPTDGGAKVEAVVRDGPADKGGLRVGDVVTQVDKKAVRSPADLSEAVRKTAAGETLTLTFIRDTSEETAKVKVGAWPSWYGPSAPRTWDYSWSWPEGMRAWRQYLPPARPSDHSGAMERLQKDIEKLRKQMDELRKRVDQHMSGKPSSSI